MISVLALALIVAAADAKYQRLVSPCETRRWHIDIENVDKPGCSNSWKVPSSWSSSPHIESLMFYKTSEECCDDLFGGHGECNVVDFCECLPDPTSDEPGTCALQTEQPYDEGDAIDRHCAGKPKWHFDIESKEGCSNSHNYPVQWNNPKVAPDMLYETPFACCAKFLSMGGKCIINDICKKRRHMKEIKLDVDNFVQASSNATAPDKMPVYMA